MTTPQCSVAEAIARRVREVLASSPPMTSEQRARAVSILAGAKFAGTAKAPSREAA